MVPYAAQCGAQFNIFYPDLIDKAKAPTYKIVKEPGNEDTVLLYFSAGPPYEDIAFRIVNREWEYSHKRYDLVFWSPPTAHSVYSGFRSSFDRGCLSLWFNFRRNVRRRFSPYLSSCSPKPSFTASDVILCSIVLL